MSKTSNYWDKRALARLSEAEKNSEAYINRIKKIYNQAYKNIEKEIESVYKNYSKDTCVDVQKLKELLSKKETDKLWKTLKRQGLDKYIKNNYKSRISRLEQIQAQIYAEAKKIYPKEELEQNMCYKGIINNSYYKAVYDTQMGVGYDFSFTKIDKNIMNTLLQDNWSGKNYSERIWGNTDILADSLSELIGGALISGQSIAKTSKQIRDRFNVAKYYSDRLVRTEVNHFNNAVDAMAYENMGINKYVFVATLDSRTSKICQEMDNKVFEYKDKEVGVNFPPLHPNCRSKTRGYLGEKEEKMLKRRARNPITGKNEIIDNISYEEWAKKNGLIRNVSTTNEKLKQATKYDIIETSPSDLPIELQAKKELNNSKILTEYINNSKNANPKVKKVYSLMGKVKNMDFTVSHAKDSSLRYKINKLTGAISDVKLTVPNLKDMDDIGNINTTLHENMHFIDFMSAGNNRDYISVSSKSLIDTVSNTNANISEDISKLFKEFDDMIEDTDNNINNEFNTMFNKLNEDVKTRKISYSEYEKEWAKIKKMRGDALIEAEYNQRKLMGGGVNNLEDIYDALSGGTYKEFDQVKYGHGMDYYKTIDKRVKEIVANYGALSISRPDLIELLKADKPALVSELDKLMDSIINEYGG